VTKRRGGYRAGAGRKPLPGNPEQISMRIEADLIDLAVTVGQGQFSAGVRYLLRYAQHVYRQDAAVALPPVGEVVLVFCQQGWTVAKLDDAGRWWMAFNQSEPVELSGVTTWCNVPPTPEEQPIIRLS